MHAHHSVHLSRAKGLPIHKNVLGAHSAKFRASSKSGNRRWDPCFASCGAFPATQTAPLTRHPQMCTILFLNVCMSFWVSQQARRDAVCVGARFFACLFVTRFCVDLKLRLHTKQLFLTSATDTNQACSSKCPFMPCHLGAHSVHPPNQEWPQQTFVFRHVEPSRAHRHTL